MVQRLRVCLYDQESHKGQSLALSSFSYNYIDGITSIPISSGTQTVLYADDLLLSVCRISRQEDFTTLHRDIMAIEQWVLDNHLTFNTSKCNYMMLSRKRFPTTPFHPLMLNGLHLNRVECFGVLLSSDLSWTPHITSVCSKAKQILLCTTYSFCMKLITRRTCNCSICFCF